MNSSNQLAVASSARNQMVADAEAAVVRRVWTPLGAFLGVPVPYFGALRLGELVTRELPKPPANPQTGEWYGLDGLGRVVLARVFSASGSLIVEDVLQYGPEQMTKMTYESMVIGTETSPRMVAQRVGMASPASLSPRTYEETSRYGTVRWCMTYDTGGRCCEVQCQEEEVDGTTSSESYRLRHDERGLLSIVDNASGRAVFSRATRPPSTDLRDAAALVAPLIAAAMLRSPPGNGSDVPTLIFVGPAVPYVAWVPPGAHQDPSYSPDAFDPEEGIAHAPAVADLLKRVQSHIESDPDLELKYAASLRRHLTKSTGIRGIKLTRDDLEPL